MIQHHAVYEMAWQPPSPCNRSLLSCPLTTFYGFRLLALPGGLAVTVVSVLIYFAIPESLRWLLRKASRRRRLTSSAVSSGKAGSTEQPLTVAALGDNLPTACDRLSLYWALFGSDQPCWTTVGRLHTAGLGRETGG